MKQYNPSNKFSINNTNRAPIKIFLKKEREKKKKKKTTNGRLTLRG